MATITSTGVGSGLDVDSIVTKLMQLEQRPLLLLARKEARLTAQLSTLGTIKGSVSALKDAADALKTAGTSEVFRLSTSDSAAISGSASPAAAPGTYNVTVSQLAQSQRLVATGQSLATAAIGDGSPATLTFTFGTITGGSLDTDSGTYAGATFTADAGRSPLQIEIDATNNTLEGIRDAINASGSGVTAAIVNDGSASPYRLTISSNSTGAQSSLKIDVSGNADVSSLLANDPAGSQNLKQTQAALDARLAISGLEITRPTNNIADAIAGVTLRLSKLAENVTVSVARDNTTITSALKGLVDAYNDVNKTIGGATAFEALLQGDTATTSILSRIRSAIGAALPGSSGTDTLSALGVSFQKDGSLKFDSSRAQAAVDANSSGVMAATRAFGESLSILTGSLIGYGGSLDARTGGINRALQGISAQGDTIQRRLDVVEKRYRAQFSALDAMMASMQQTSSFLTQQLANLPKIERS